MLNILHLTNEFTKKNYSISSLISYLSNLYVKDKSLNVRITTSNLDSRLFDENKIEQFENSGFFFSIFALIKTLKSIARSDLVHIHGIWTQIQIISIVYCSIFNKNIAIHPHGMLLDEALKSAGFTKYLLKKVFLIILKLFVTSKWNFISITDQETKAVKNFFPNCRIYKIPNPIPFDLSDQNIKNKKLKQFVYFGRIHPHKNIELIIKSFLSAKLPDQWKLKIYGIEDDANYSLKLQNLIKDQTNIKICEPVFGIEKQKIMSKSWANILISKSEVLSLSILESSYYGLPTLTNKDIDLKDLNFYVVNSETNQENVREKLVEISNWSEKKRNEIGNNLNFNSKQKNFRSNIKDYLDIFYNKTFSRVKTYDTELITENKLSLNFFAISGAYAFNLMFTSLIVILLVLSKNFDVAAELGLTMSFWLSTTQIFSSNVRSISITENDADLANETRLYRIFFSLVSLSLFYIVLFFFLKVTNLNLILSISIMILSQWVFEMTLARYEIRKKYFFFYLFLIINLVVVSVVLYSILFLSVNILIDIFLAYSMLTLLMFIFDFQKINLSSKFIVNTINRNLKSIAFASSFSIVSSSFIWRLLIFTFLEKSIAGIIYASFSIGSFPGTLFNSVIGPTFIKNKIRIGKFLSYLIKLIFVILVISLLMVIFRIINLSNLNSFNFLNNEFFLFTTLVSLIGSYFMSNAMYNRHKKIQSNILERKKLFGSDVNYGLTIIVFVPVLYFLGGVFGVSLSFFMASIFAFLVYRN